MKTQVREFENQKWIWNEQGVEVFDLMRKKRHQAKWQEVLRIGGRFVKLQNGKGLLFAVPVEERRWLGKDLGEAFRENNPCAWAAAARKSVKRLRMMCLMVVPSFISLFMLVPWVVLYFLILAKGADMPEINEITYIKWVVIGVFSVLLYPGLYFFKLRSDSHDVLGEAGEIELKYGCGRMG